MTLSTVDMFLSLGRHKPLTQLDYSMFLQASLDMEHTPLIDIHLEYVTRLDFGSAFYRNSGKFSFDSYTPKLDVFCQPSLLSEFNHSSLFDG
jgi:hypothetical protein